MNRSIPYQIKIYAAAFLSGCCLFISCGNSDKEILELTQKIDLREEARGVESYISQQGKIKARLLAPLMYRANAGDTMFVEFPSTMHVDFFNDSSGIDSRLDCLYGKYFENYNKVYLRDSVVVISVKGDTLRCRDLWWDQDKGLFYSDKYSRYIAKGQDLQGGRGMEATQDLKSVTFKDPTGTVDVSDQGIPE